MANPKFIRFPFAATGDKETIPDEAQTSGALSYSEGFGLDYERDPTKDAKAKRMPRDGTNQVLYDATSNIQQYQLYGAPFWYDASHNGGTAIPYQKNAIVRYANEGQENVYISLKDNNTDSPNVETSWFLFAPYDATLLSRLSVVPFMPVTSMTLTTPPATPTTNQLYLVPANATGTWTNKNGQLTEWNGTKWTFALTNEGHSIGLPDGRLFTKINGTYIEKIALDAQSGKWNYAESSGTANALTATLNPAPTTLNTATSIRLKIKTTNTSAATLNLNGLGVKPILNVKGQALIQGDLIAGDIVELTYNGNAFIMASTPSLIQTGGVAVFNKAGAFTWVFPEGVNRVWAEVYGAGGGAALYSNTNTVANYEGEGGGGGGGYAAGWIYGITGTVINGYVGAQGQNKGEQGVNAVTGGTSAFGTISATGGGGATWTGGPGSGGYGSGGLINLVGQVGVDGNTSTYQYAGFGGDAAGPHGGKGAQATTQASWPGGGGMMQWHGTNLTHGAAADGGVILFW